MNTVTKDMSLIGIRTRVQEIRDRKHDPESAHGLEDKLYIDFVKMIADSGTNEQRAAARECLKTLKIQFARWCA